MASDDLWEPVETAAFLKKSLGALAQWRYLGQGPRFVKLGRSVRYRVSDVEAWLDQQTRQHTGEPSNAVMTGASSFPGRPSTDAGVGGDAA